jgi:HSP20 family protein
MTEANASMRLCHLTAHLPDKENMMNTFVRLHNLQNRLNPACATRVDSGNNIDALFSDFFRPVLNNSVNPTASTGAPVIRLDVQEDEKSYFLSAAIAGVKKEDIQLEIDKNEISITVEVKAEVVAEAAADANTTPTRTLHRERRYGKSTRSIVLAEDIDEEKIDAKYVDGVLALTLPKKAVVSAKRITIN